MLIVARVRSCSSSPVSVHGRWLLFVVCGSRFGWWWLACIVVGDGEGRGWASPLVCSGLVVVVVTCVPSWALGISSGQWWLVVVILGWEGQGGLFLGGGGHFHGWSASSWSNNSLGCVLACDMACHIVVIIVGGGCEQMAMVAVGDSGDMAGLGQGS